MGAKEHPINILLLKVQVFAEMYLEGHTYWEDVCMHSIRIKLDFSEFLYVETTLDLL